MSDSLNRYMRKRFANRKEATDPQIQEITKRTQLVSFYTSLPLGRLLLISRK
jgi:hypothetical protein